MKKLLVGVGLILAACNGDVSGVDQCSGSKPAAADHVVSAGLYAYQTTWPGGTLVGDMTLSRTSPDSVAGYIDVVRPGASTRRVSFTRRDATNDVQCLNGEWVDQTAYMVTIEWSPPGVTTSGQMLHRISRAGLASEVLCVAEFIPTESFPGQMRDTIRSTACSMRWRGASSR